MKTHFRHRHYLVAPFMVGALVLSLLPSLESSPASVLASQGMEEEQGTVYTTRGGGTLLAFDSAEVEHVDGILSLQQGSALLKSNGLSVLQAKDTDIIVLHGAAHIHVTANTVKIAALTAPVLVRQGDRAVLVPAARQWEWTGALPDIHADYATYLHETQSAPLPDTFRVRQLTLLQSFVDQHESVLPIGASSFFDLDLSLLQLPAARERAEAGDTEDVLHALQMAVEANDGAALQDAWRTYSTALQTQRSREVAALLLSQSHGGAAVDSVLTQILLTDTSLSPLLAVHPRTREFAWTFGLDSFSASDRQVLWHSFPETDFADTSAASLVWSRWEELVQSDLVVAEDPTALLTVLLLGLADTYERFTRECYPQRASALADAVYSITTQNPAYLSAAAEAALGSFAQEPVGLLDPSALLAQEQESLPEPTQDRGTGMEPQEAEETMHEIVEQFGALILEDTQVTALDPYSVSVRSVQFGTSERVVNFTMDMQTKAVRDISDSTKDYPLVMEFADFLQWARK